MKRIRMLTATAWWDEGQTFRPYAEDEKHIMFQSQEGRVCAVLKEDEGKMFIFLKPTEHQAYYQENRREVLEQKRNYRKELKEQVLIRLGARCSKCGYSQMGALDVTGGTPRGKKGYTAYYNEVLKIVEMSTEHPYSLICANCRRLEEDAKM